MLEREDLEHADELEREDLVAAEEQRKDEPEHELDDLEHADELEPDGCHSLFASAAQRRSQSFRAPSSHARVLGCAALPGPLSAPAGVQGCGARPGPPSTLAGKCR